MSDSIFTKIIKGEIPCYKIFEDETTFAFLDIHPIQPGHTLVIPKRQIEFVWDLTDTEYQAVMKTVKAVAKRMRQVFPDKTRIAMQIEGLDVPHAHVKVFPFSTSTEFHHLPNTTQEPNHAELAAIAKKLQF